MVEIDRVGKHTYIVENPSFKHEGLFIHGYGGNKEELLGPASNLAQRFNLRLAVFDLPGHGAFASKMFTLDNSLEALRMAIKTLDKPEFAIGHSIGARLALMTGMPIAALISPPGEIVFEGGRAELFRILRARRVAETAAYAGLKEILSVGVEPARETLLLKASLDLKSVSAFVDSWRKRGFDSFKISSSDHLDIISSPETGKIVGQWLETKTC